MGAQWISIYVLVGMFVLAAVLPINMGGSPSPARSSSARWWQA